MGFDAIRIVKPAKHGLASTSNSIADYFVVYRSTMSYHGPDSYTFEVSGGTGMYGAAVATYGSSVATITINMDVR